MVKLFITKFFKTPPVYFALPGAAVSYYFAPLSSLFFMAAVLFLSLSFFWVLANLPASAASCRRPYRISAAGLCALGIGLFLGFGARMAVEKPRSFGLEDGAVTAISGVLKEDPRLTAGGRGLGLLKLEGAAGKGGIRVSARGEVTVFFPEGEISRLRAFGRGSSLFLEGELARDRTGKASLFRARSVHVTRPAPALENFRTSIRLRLMGRFAPYDWGGLALALLLGIRDNLDTDLASSYKSAGCSHVLALSGMHLAIVSGLLAFFLKKPLGLRAAAIAGGGFIAAYVFLIGLQPSLVRAAIMYLLGALAVLGSLPKRPSLLLALAFLIQLALWPSSGNSLSFMLSYLALGGILVLGEAFHFLLRGKAPEIILRPFSASVGAFIATAPVTAAFFGMVQPVGILAGLIVVPLTTLFMIAAMAAPVLSALVPPLGRAADFMLSLLYQILEKIVAAASLVPSPPASRWQAVLLVSLGLSALILFIHYRENFRSKSLAPFNAG